MPREVSTTSAENVTQDVPRDEELRLALVMNGGVSLAVWIGGVTHEINRFAGETHLVYRSLLELTSTRARVDVISGTSAGGINGAALALSSVYDTSLLSLRNLWLNRGAFSDLLRSADARNPSSLLDGDGYFLPALSEAFRGLTAAAPRLADAAPMDLTMTATMLRGEAHSRLDDFGERVEDVHHRALFHVQRGPRDPFAKPDELVNTLAEAARASASFPVAFEPRFYDKSRFVNAVTGAAPVQDRYLIDGGVLDNKPLRSALSAIFNMRTTGNARRVLAYVVPDPAANAGTLPDTLDAPPSLAEVATASLLGIPSSQSIADQLREIDLHNAAVRTQRHSFAWLAAQLSSSALAPLAATLFPAYRARRIDGLLDYVLDEISAGLADAHSSGEQAMAKGDTSRSALGLRTREWLKACWKKPRDTREPWAGSIPSHVGSCELNADGAAGWDWGLFTLEFVAGVTLDLLRRTQRLWYLAQPDGAASTARSFPSMSASVRDEDDEALRVARTHGGPGSTTHSGTLPALWAELNRVYSHPHFARDGASRTIRANKRNAGILNELHSLAPSEQDADFEERLVNWLDESITNTSEQQNHWGELARKLAHVLFMLDGPIREVLSSKRTLRPDEAAAKDELTRLRTLLLDGANPSEVLRRLLYLEVIHYSMAGRAAHPDVAVELVQISGHCKSPWSNLEAPKDKLTGMQLAHFGAFYRKSWRANDWMMGRLDGIDRIVRIALNPDRLQRLYAGQSVVVDGKQLLAADYVYEFLRRLAVEAAEADHRVVLEREWEKVKAAIRAELAFLSATDARVPESLANCAQALIRRLQLEVLCTELPVVATSEQDDEAVGAARGKAGAGLVARIRTNPIRGLVSKWRQALTSRTFSLAAELRGWLAFMPSQVLPAEVAADAFKDFPVGRERLTQEAGSDLMTRISSQTLAVLHAALVGKQSGLARVRGIFKLLTLPVRFLHLLANRLVSESRTSAAVGSALLVGGFMLLVGSVLVDEPSEWAAPVGWSLLFGWFASTLLRQAKLRVSITLVVILCLCTYGLAPVASYKLIATVVIGAVALAAPGWLFAVVASIAALWWTMGHPAWNEVSSAACDGALAITGCKAAGATNKAAHFVAALQLLCVVFALSAVAYVGGRRRASG